MPHFPRRRLAALLLLAAVPIPARAAGTRAVLFRTPDCACCAAHAAYLADEGFDVTLNTTTDLAAMSRKAGIPDALQGCHLIEVDGYVVSGHVQASTIRKLLRERPAELVGLTLPGMPSGTPGMPGPRTGRLQVLAIARGDGHAAVYDVQ